MFENIGPGHGLESSMQSVEQQSKRTQSGGEQRLKRAQSGSSSWTRGGGKWGAAVEVDAAIRPQEQQLKRMQAASSS